MKERLLFPPIRLLFLLLVIGLVYTQAARFPYYSRLSKDNAIRVIPIDGPRGTIFDRNGIPVVSNRISFNVAVVYQELKNRERLIRLLTGLLNTRRKDVEKAIDKASKRPYAPVTIIEDIDRDKAFILEEESFNVNGLIIQTKSVRSYPYNSVGAHIFGYLSEINEAELENMKEYGCRIKDLIGRDGIEKYYDRFLSGSDGGIQVQVDNKGRHVRTLGFKEPSAGKDLYLTIDIRLQEACDALLEGRSGAAIVMDPYSGEILALSSSPSFDPNIFIKNDMAEQRMRLLTDKSKRPLLNRAVSGLYQPGSIFKVVVASGALETSRIKRGTRFNCGGAYTLGRDTFDCWKEGGHGPQEVTDALMNSCNVFFYNAGRALGVDNMENFARIFGFGRKTGIDLPDEAKGIVPGRIWKRLGKKDNWYEGDTINFAIGQGYILATPLQILDMMAVMANKGGLVKPHLVKEIGAMGISNSGLEGRARGVIDRKDLGLSADTLRIVRAGLYKVVNSENGTGRRAKLEGAAAAGKTGTAQNPSGRTHAWFSGFAPFDDARICVVVFLEHGGKGGVEPSAIARAIFQDARDRGYVSAEGGYVGVP